MDRTAETAPDDPGNRVADHAQALVLHRCTGDVPADGTADQTDQ